MGKGEYIKMDADIIRTITALLGSSLITIGFYIQTKELGATLIMAGLFAFILHLSIKEE
jgi:hypothetical protein